MMKRIVLVVLAALLAGGFGSMAQPRPALAAGLCFGSTGTSDKIYVDKDKGELGGFTFDYVRGDAYVGNMNPCVGNAAFPEGSGTWVLLANIEDNDSNAILQIGYGKGCSLCADEFVYTPGGAGSGVSWPGALDPISGHRVRGIIQQLINPDTGAKSTKYTVRDITTAVEESRTLVGWHGGFDKAWWGVEALDTSSEVGPDAGGPDSNMAYMGYSTTQSTTIFYRSGMVFDSCYCENTADNPSSIEKQGSTNSAEHGHLGTWVYGNDMVNFESH